MLRQADHYFKDSLGYITRPCLKNNKEIKIIRLYLLLNL